MRDFSEAGLRAGLRQGAVLGWGCDGEGGRFTGVPQPAAVTSLRGVGGPHAGMARKVICSAAFPDVTRH
jgi:hypothetical protein